MRRRRERAKSEILTDTFAFWGITAQAKHAAFAAKRNQHYGNEAEAMKIAAALAAQDDDEEQEAGLPPVPINVNGAAAR